MPLKMQEILGFDPWIGKIPWRREWLPTSVFLPRKSHGQRSLVGYSPWGHKRVRHDWATKQKQVEEIQAHLILFHSTLLHFTDTAFVTSWRFVATLHCQITIVQLLSHVWLFVTPWTAAYQASLSFIITRSLLKLISIQSVMPSNHFILCHPLLLGPSILPSIRVFSGEPALCIRRRKYWSFRFSISPSNEYSGLISIKINWFDL